MRYKINAILKLKNLLFVSLILVLFFSSRVKLIEYLHLDWSLNMLWIILLPFIIYIKQKGVYSYRYGIMSSIFLIAYLTISAPIFFFFAFCFGVFFILEISIGKLNSLAPFVVILVTPLSKYVFDLFGFPIRLALSKFAAQLLSFIGHNINSQGNIIMLNGNIFSVDAACMGLRLVITSFLITFMLISFFEKKTKSEIKISTGIITLIITFILVIVANLLRIIFLIILNSPPNTISHELIGLGSMIIGVIVPMYFIIQYFSSFFKKIKQVNYKGQNQTLLKYSFILLFISFFSVLGIKKTVYNDMEKDELVEKITLQNYNKKILPNHIVKFLSPNYLMYIKPAKNFYRSDHNPFICWRGSGYIVTNEKQIELYGKEIFYAQLVSETNTLHTAWWYDNGKYQTVNQLDWRWRAMQGEAPFRLINLTAETPNHLFTEVARFLKDTPLKK